MARFVASDNSRRPYGLRRCAQALVTRATEVSNGRTLECSSRAVTLSAWIHARAGDGGARKGSAVFLLAHFPPRLPNRRLGLQRLWSNTAIFLSARCDGRAKYSFSPPLWLRALLLKNLLQVRPHLDSGSLATVRLLVAAKESWTGMLRARVRGFIAKRRFSIAEVSTHTPTSISKVDPCPRTASDLLSSGPPQYFAMVRRLRRSTFSATWKTARCVTLA